MVSGVAINRWLKWWCRGYRDWAGVAAVADTGPCRLEPKGRGRFASGGDSS
jgi:hypothetical protein